MNDSSSTQNDLINILLVLVLATVIMIITQRTLRSLIFIYAAQSALLAAMAMVLFWKTDDWVLPGIAALTVASKVIVIPYMLRKIQKRLNIRRDVEFRYLSPITSVALSAILIFIVYSAFPQALRDLWPEKQFYLSAVIGVSIMLTGMIVVFSRRKMITKIVGYLTMENGVLLFGLFVAELPFIIEALIVIDLIMLTVLATILAFGIDSTIDDFHKRLKMFNSIHFKRQGKP